MENSSIKALLSISWQRSQHELRKELDFTAIAKLSHVKGHAKPLIYQCFT